MLDTFIGDGDDACLNCMPEPQLIISHRLLVHGQFLMVPVTSTAAEIPEASYSHMCVS